MDYSTFDTLMIQGIAEKWIFFGVLVVLIIIHEIYFVRHKFKTKSEERASKNLGQFLIIASAIIFVIKLDATWFMLRDVINHNYVEVHGIYSMDSEWSEHDTYRWLSVTSDDGKEIQVKLPGYSHGENRMFPPGTYEGTVWYAQNSECIVAFIPDEPIPED